MERTEKVCMVYGSRTKRMKVTHVETECGCGREIRSVVPWDNSLRERGAFVKCSECGHINHGDAKYE